MSIDYKQTDILSCKGTEIIYTFKYNFSNLPLDIVEKNIRPLPLQVWEQQVWPQEGKVYLKYKKKTFT